MQGPASSFGFAQPYIPSADSNSATLKRKKPRVGISLDVQKQVWDIHIGTGKKTAPCPLCGERQIECPSKRCGLECAHIVASKFAPDKPSPLSLFPSCSACNNRCEDDCILDFLFKTGRHAELERLIRSVHSYFCMLNPDQPSERLLMPVVIDTLYGFERFKAGGGIHHDVEIGQFAKMVHAKKNMEDQKALHAKLSESIEELGRIATYVPKQKRPPVVF